MTKKIKLPKNRKDWPVQTITLPRSDYQPTKAELEEKHSIFTDTGTTPEQWGDTEEERMDNMVDFILQPVKIKRER